MEPALNQSNQPVEEDEWDTEGFVIPSLTVGDSGLSNWDEPNLKDLKPPPKGVKEEEKIYLGPHGAPPSQAKHQDLNAAGRKQRFKQKLKEADHKYSGTGRENKVDTLRELVGGKVSSKTMPKNSPREWLDPHCHESHFERTCIPAMKPLKLVPAIKPGYFLGILSAATSLMLSRL